MAAIPPTITGNVAAAAIAAPLANASVEKTNFIAISLLARDTKTFSTLVPRHLAAAQTAS